MSDDSGKGAKGAVADLDVVFPRHVSIWVRSHAIHGDGLPLSGRYRVVGRTGALAVLHLDGVK